MAGPRSRKLALWKGCIGALRHRDREKSLFPAATNHYRPVLVCSCVLISCFIVLATPSGRPAIIISPLISLMRDQCAAMQQRGPFPSTARSMTIDPADPSIVFGQEFLLVFSALRSPIAR